MICNARLSRNHTSTQKAHLISAIKMSLINKMKPANISIVTSITDMRRPLTQFPVKEHINYRSRLDKIYEEFANEVISDITCCIHDYPERYVGISGCAKDIIVVNYPYLEDIYDM